MPNPSPQRSSSHQPEPSLPLRQALIVLSGKAPPESFPNRILLETELETLPPQDLPLLMEHSISQFEGWVLEMIHDISEITRLHREREEQSSLLSSSSQESGKPDVEGLNHSFTQSVLAVDFIAMLARTGQRLSPQVAIQDHDRRTLTKCLTQTAAISSVAGSALERVERWFNAAQSISFLFPPSDKLRSAVRSLLSRTSAAAFGAQARHANGADLWARVVGALSESLELSCFEIESTLMEGANPSLRLDQAYDRRVASQSLHITASPSIPCEINEFESASLALAHMVSFSLQNYTARRSVALLSAQHDPKVADSAKELFHSPEDLCCFAINLLDGSRCSPPVRELLQSELSRFLVRLGCPSLTINHIPLYPHPPKLEPNLATREMENHEQPFELPPASTTGSFRKTLPMVLSGLKPGVTEKNLLLLSEAEAILRGPVPGTAYVRLALATLKSFLHEQSLLTKEEQRCAQICLQLTEALQMRVNAHRIEAPHEQPDSADLSSLRSSWEIFLLPKALEEAGAELLRSSSKDRIAQARIVVAHLNQVKDVLDGHPGTVFSDRLHARRADVSRILELVRAAEFATGAPPEPLATSLEYIKETWRQIEERIGATE